MDTSMVMVILQLKGSLSYAEEQLFDGYTKMDGSNPPPVTVTESRQHDARGPSYLVADADDAKVFINHVMVTGLVKTAWALARW